MTLPTVGDATNSQKRSVKGGSRMQSTLERVMKNEDFRSFVYDDKNQKRVVPGYTMIGHATIGHGIRFLEEDESQVVVSMKLQKIRAKLERAIEGFDKHPEQVREALVEMAYIHGMDGFFAYRLMFKALYRQDYVTAAAEILNSQFAEESGNRALIIAAMVRGGRNAA